VAIVVLKNAEEGKLDLAEALPVSEDDLRPVGSVEARWKPGMKLSIEDLCRRMIVESDNSAVDLLLRRLGGPKAVQARLEGIGVKGIDISISELSLMAIPKGVKELPADEKCSPACLKKRVAAVPDADRKKALAAFRTDARNTASPEALGAMLVRLQKGELLRTESMAKLTPWMTESQTGRNRIRALLPKETSTASKTGTGYGCVNDAGIVTLPGGKGHIALVVFVKHSKEPTEKVEKAMAEIAREVVKEMR
jgi:beta-lactamase class A